MYSRAVTQKIVEYWALGFTAEETRVALMEKYEIHPCLDTIYRHRHSLTAQDLIDELLRQQERSILKAESEDRALAMKYRDKLLDKLMPHHIKAETTYTEKIMHIHLSAKLMKDEPTITAAHT